MEGITTECPICFKEVFTNAIENHVSKCLFLNESSQVTNMLLKRPTLINENPATKRPRLNVRNNNEPKNIERFFNTSAYKCDISNSKIEEIKKEEHNIFLNKEYVHNNRCTEQKQIPLAKKMRPNNILEYIGQKHVLGHESILQQLMSKTEIPNLILWGPPGCGKTSLVNVIANVCKCSTQQKYCFIELSASASGVNDIKEIVKVANNKLKFRCKTIIFLDEIHRFNKTQQDIFLPYVESGIITLIGATTENPSFSLNPALLSRCYILMLEKLKVENLITILENAVKLLNGTIQNINHENKDSKFLIDHKIIKWLAKTSDGDARIALGGLELAVRSMMLKNSQTFCPNLNVINLEDVQHSIKMSHMLYDRKGDQHYDTISALHKSIRVSDESASIYWLSRMLAGGEDPAYISRRLVRMACEDIGLADPKALGMAVHIAQACRLVKMPESDVLLAQCVTYLARAPKSRLMEIALGKVKHMILNSQKKQPSVPLYLRIVPMNSIQVFGLNGKSLSDNDHDKLSVSWNETEYANFLN